MTRGDALWANAKGDAAHLEIPFSSSRWARLGRLLDWQRYFAEKYLLLPAAHYLPLWFALFLSDTFGWLDALVPSFTAAIVHREIQVSTGASGWRLLRLSAERKANIRKDLVYLARLSTGRDHPGDWSITESGRSMANLTLDKKFWIVASGHFPIAAQIAMLQNQPSDRDFLIVATPEMNAVGPAPLRHQLRTRLQFAAASKVAADMNAVNTATTTVTDKGAVYLLQLIATLQKSAGTFSLLIDVAGSSKLSHVRPFAGWSRLEFAVGAPHIARFSKSQVVPYVATFGRKPKSVVVEWGPSFALGEDASIPESLDRLLNWLEQGIAHHPTQYLFPIGVERFWDPATSTWREPGAQPVAAAMPASVSTVS